MSEITKAYISMAKQIENPIKKLSEKGVMNAVSGDLIVTGSAISPFADTLAAGSNVNPGTLYDSALTIQALSANLLRSQPSEEVITIEKISKIAVEEIKKQLKPDDSEHILDYYRNLTDFEIVSKGIEEVCEQLSQSKEPESLWDLVKNWFADAKTRILGAIQGLPGIIGTIGQELIQVVTDLGATIGENVTKFAEKASEFVNKIHEFTLSLIRKMFKFVAEIQTIANNNKWNIQEINIEMPSCEVNVVTIGPVPIPIPKLSTPKLSVKFLPTK